MATIANPWKIGGTCGIAFVICFFVGIIFLQGEVPMYDAPIDEIRDFWETDGGTYLLGDWIGGMGFVFGLLPFVVAVTAVLARAEGGVAFFSRLAFVGGVLLFAAGSAGAIGWGTLALGASMLSDDTLRAFMVYDAYAFGTVAAMAALMLLGASLAILQTNLFWRWLGFFGLAVTALQILGTLSTLDRDPSMNVLDVLSILGFAGTAIWILAASIGMLMHKEAAAVDATMAPQAGPAPAGTM